MTVAGLGLGLDLLHPARKDEEDPRYFPNWLRQRVEAIIRTCRASSAWDATAAASQQACGPDRPAPACPQFRDLAQLADRRARQTIFDPDNH
jgi:hypothetical protein